jgi:hypothetical protein
MVDISNILLRTSDEQRPFTGMSVNWNKIFNGKYQFQDSVTVMILPASQSWDSLRGEVR